MESCVFFMRFYNLKKEEVIEAILKMQDGYFFKYEIYPTEKSCNMFVPSNSWQVDFIFDEEKELQRFKKDPNIISIYLSVSPVGAKLEERAPGDVVYQVGG